MRRWDNVYDSVGMTMFSIVVLTVLFSCTSSHRSTLEVSAPREQMPVMAASGVSTLISDSGMTRYRIVAPVWDVYDKTEPTYWEFKQGIYLENFTPDLRVSASLKADYAHYNETDQIWYLSGHVESMNLQGEQFFTPELYWSQRDERVYSDSCIKVIRESSTIEGVGFESNPDLTRYTILNPKGHFPVKE